MEIANREGGDAGFFLAGGKDNAIERCFFQSRRIGEKEDT
jgi:hypothetical protein